jgi:hypothetical protein
MAPSTPRYNDLDPVPASPGEPVWPLARLFPHQGDWSEDQYLDLNASFLVEYAEGCLEFPTIPSIAHQLIVLFIFKVLDAYVAARNAGWVLVAPLPVRLWPDKAREPDVTYIRPDRPRYRGKYPEGADLVVEVVGEGAEDRLRDLVTKRGEYHRLQTLARSLPDESFCVCQISGKQKEVRRQSADLGDTFGKVRGPCRGPERVAKEKHGRNEREDADAALFSGARRFSHALLTREHKGAAVSIS